MKDENRICLFKYARSEIVEKLFRHKSAVGTLFSGGIVRGFADEYSDLDVLLFLEHEDAAVRSSIRALAKEIEHRFSVETDIEVHVLDAYMQGDWMNTLSGTSRVAWLCLTGMAGSPIFSKRI